MDPKNYESLSVLPEKQKVNVDFENHDPDFLNDLLPVRKSFVPVLVPLLVLVLVLGGCVWGWFQFVQPTFEEQEQIKQTNQEVLSSFKGYTVVDKVMDESCLRLGLLSPDGKTTKTLCAPEILWDANEVGQSYVYVDLNKNQ